jgi:UDP-glucuronate decarboxylase
MRVLVFGGAGFLGSHLVERLSTLGHEVFAIDDMSTGSYSNIDGVKCHVGRYDIRDFPFTEGPFVEPSMRHQRSPRRFDVIYNLACPASPVHYQSDPIKTFTTCVMGTQRALEFAKLSGATLVQASTSEVYGDPDRTPQLECYRGNVNPIGVRACYDEGKRGSETLCFDYQRTFGLKIKVVRIFNTYGPKMNVNDGRVVSNFIVQALKGDDITVYGHGMQTRSFCYVDDLIDGFVDVVKTSNSFVGPMNIGNDVEFTVLDLAKKIVQMTGSSSKIVHTELPQDDPTQRRPSLLLAKKMIGYEPKTTLDEGLRRTIKYFESKL